MSEFLVKAISNTHPDPDIDRESSYKKGDIVVVMPDNHEWGGREGPPNFVIVKCPELLWDGDADPGEETGAYERRDAWEYLFDFSVIQSNLNQDGHRVEASSRYPGVLNQAGITRNMIENYLNRWNATVQSIGTNFVRFDFLVRDAIASEGFWDTDKALLAEFTENNYDKTTGQHNTTINLTPVIDAFYAERPEFPRNEWASKVIQQFNVMAVKRGATGLNVNGENITMDVGRDDVRINFLEDVGRKARKIFTRRRWHFSEDDVDQALAAPGGVVELTLTQLGNRLLDKTAE